MSAANMFVPIRFRTHIQLTPAELDHQFAERLHQKIRSTYEGVCSRFGFIKPASISVIKRSLGCLLKPHFNGHVRFELICSAEACNPHQGMVIQAVVKTKNTFGLLAESTYETANGTITPVLDIIVPRKSAGIASDLEVDLQEIGDTIYIEVVVKRFLTKDKKISVIGRLVSPNNLPNNPVPVFNGGDDLEEGDIEDELNGGFEVEDEEEQEGGKEQDEDREPVPGGATSVLNVLKAGLGEVNQEEGIDSLYEDDEDDGGDEYDDGIGSDVDDGDDGFRGGGDY